MRKKRENDLVEVFSGSATEASIVKSLLENAEIMVFLKDSTMGSIAPWYAAPGGAGAVKVMVSNQDQEKASIVVDEFNINISSDDLK